MGLVHGFEDRLPQALLPLSGEQQPLDEFPGVLPAAAHERLRDVAAHLTDLVLARRGLLQDLEHALAADAARVDRAGEQPAEIRGAGPAREVGRPRRHPLDVLVDVPQHRSDVEQPDAAAVSERLGGARAAEGLAGDTMLIRPQGE